MLAVMDLTEEDVNDFIVAWNKDFGETPAPDVARSEMRRLLDFFVTLEELLHNRIDPDEQESANIDFTS